MSKIICGDSLTELCKLPSGSIHCCITSPPYWGLRDYGVKDQLGLEKTPEEYVAKMVEVFREVRRVLRQDGTLWLVLGDSYAGNCSRVSSGRAGYGEEREGIFKRGGDGLKPKDLVGIPWRVAFALQADGWYLRQDIIWNKPNPMPESVTDRCTKSHEYIFLLSKNLKYYFDNEAVKEESKGKWNSSKGVSSGGIRAKFGVGTAGGEQWNSERTHENINKSGRNRRSVWTVTTKSFKEAHFATFPHDLVEPMIKAGTSERGCCPECGNLWKRVMKKRKADRTNSRPFSKSGNEKNRNDVGRIYEETVSVTVGWRPTCTHYPKANKWKEYIRYKDKENPRTRLLKLFESYKTVSCTILDPFFGAGTTGLVAKQLGRDFVGIELNKKYCRMAKKRITNAQRQGKLSRVHRGVK